MVGKPALGTVLLAQVVALRHTVARFVGFRQAPIAAGRRLSDRHERLQAVLDAVPAFIAYVDADQRYRLTNHRYAHLHGRRAETLRGKRVRDVVGSTAYAQARSHIEAALGGRSNEFEMPFGTDAQGREQYVYASYVPDVGADGSVVGLVAMVVDITERKRAELALAASEHRWRTVFESACVGMAIVDAEGRPLETNQALQRFFGAGEAELRGTRWADLTYSPDRAHSVDLFREVVDGRRSDFRMEKRYVRRDQAIVWGETAVTGIRDANGVFQYAVPMVMDTTAQKDAEQGLRESEARFRQILEAAPDAMVIVSRERGITMVNAQAGALFGYTSEELLGQSIELLVPEHLRGEHARLAEHYFDQPRSRRMGGARALFARRKDGTEVPVEVSLSPVETTGGPVVIAAIRDVTERKEAEQALRKSEVAYRDLVMHATFGIYRSSREGTLLSANSALAEMLGYVSVDELVGIDLGSAVYVDRRQREALVAQYLTRDTIMDVEVEWKRTDGHPITVRLNGRALRDEHGDVEGFEVIVEDVTERQRLEAQLRQAQKMEAVGRLAGGVAHDFNNILTAILGVTDLLLLDPERDAPSLRSDLTEIHDSAGRAAALTTQLLAFSRGQVLSPQPLDINVLVTKAERLLQRVIGEDVQIETALDAAVGTVEVDAGQMEQVLLNLAVNARDAMPDGGTLAITTRNVEIDPRESEDVSGARPGPYVLLVVTDTGVGMDSDTRSHVFEPFYTTKEVGKGTGLGLATVYGIVKQSGGHIRLVSELGQGTRFEIYLPRIDATAERLGSDSDIPAPGGTETILLVEDDDSVRSLAQRVLERRGYAVLSASNGEEALEILRRRETDIGLLVSDLVMPGMGGYRLWERLRQEGKTVKCLFMSGYGERDGHERSMLESGIPFLQKPWTVGGLLRKVRDVLDQPG